MSDLEEYIDKRRRLLIEMLTAGAFASVLPAKSAWAGLPNRLSSGELITSGTIEVNGREATAATRITAQDTITTRAGSYAIFVLGGNAILLRANSSVTLYPENRNLEVIRGMRLVAGRLLSVSREQEKWIKTPSANIKARGTGFYLESEEDKTYCCICYGSIDVESTTDRTQKTSVEHSKHHDRPLYMHKYPKDGASYIQDGPFINHGDPELRLIEALVGRVPEFS